MAKSEAQSSTSTTPPITWVAVIGSRGYPKPDLVRAVVAKFKPTTGVVSGACPNSPDAWAVEAARATGHAVREIPADWDRYGKRAGFLRNGDVVAAAAYVVAFWNGTSRGTADALVKAAALSKPVRVYGPDGTIMADWVERAEALVGRHRPAATAPLPTASGGTRWVVNKRQSAYDVYIGRPSRYGNPFEIGKHGTRDEVVAKHRQWLAGEIPAPAGSGYTTPPTTEEIRRDLKGKVLACFCAPLACHGDTLAAIANA